MQHTVNLTLTVQAASLTDARAIAMSAGEHLLETFNDDSSLQGCQVGDADAILLPFNLADSTCFDLMCTASEGGINYWADIIKRKGQRREDSPVPDIVSFEADVQDGPVTCDHPEIEAAEIGRFTIDPDMIRAGVRRLLAPDAQISPAIRNDCAMQLTDPEHAADADTADAIVQFAVFGELVFG